MKGTPGKVTDEDRARETYVSAEHLATCAEAGYDTFSSLVINAAGSEAKPFGELSKQGRAIWVAIASVVITAYRAGLEGGEEDQSQ